jgi:hypothetical protein
MKPLFYLLYLMKEFFALSMVDPTSFHVGLVEPVRQKNQRVNAVAVTLTEKVIFVNPHQERKKVNLSTKVNQYR